MMSSGRWRVVLAVAVGLSVTAMIGCGGAGQRLEKERNALIVQNNEAQDIIDEMRRTIDALNMENQALRDDLANKPVVSDQGMTGFGPDVDVIPGAGRITLRVGSDVLFAPGKAELKSTSKNTLASIAKAIQAEHPGRRVRVEGYTDTDPIKKSNWEDNLELSLQRAASVHRYLEEQGVSGELMYAAGYGDHKPRETKKQSRRVEIVVLIEGE